MCFSCALWERLSAAKIAPVVGVVMLFFAPSYAFPRGSGGMRQKKRDNCLDFIKNNPGANTPGIKIALNLSTTTVLRRI